MKPPFHPSTFIFTHLSSSLCFMACIHNTLIILPSVVSASQYLHVLPCASFCNWKKIVAKECYRRWQTSRKYAGNLRVGGQHINMCPTLKQRFFIRLSFAYFKNCSSYLLHTYQVCFLRTQERAGSNLVQQ